MFTIFVLLLYLDAIKVYSATFRDQHRRRVAIKRVQLLDMVDSKARADCVKEIQLLKVTVRFEFGKNQVP